MSDFKYQRLTRARRRNDGGIFRSARGVSSLWLGEDHLLSVDSAWFEEQYKRFYFRDIQAFTLRRTYRQLWLGIGLGLPLIFLLWGIAANLGSDGDDVGLGFCLFFAMLFGGAFFYNLFAGATVRTYLQTAVQTEELSPLNRFRRANKVINRLRPLIAQAQGEVSREELPQRVAEAQAAAAAEEAAHSARAQSYAAPAAVELPPAPPASAIAPPPPGELPPVL